MTSTQFMEGWEKNQNLLKGFAMKLTKNYDDANDLLQETSLRAFSYRKQFRKGTNLKAWLSTIMRNTFINHLRKVKRRMTVNDGTDNNHYLNNTLLKAQMNEGESSVMMEEIMGLIDGLDETLRVPFLLHFQGYKYNEIGEVLNKPLGTVKSRIFFARKELKSKIEKYYLSKYTAEILS